MSTIFSIGVPSLLLQKARKALLANALALNHALKAQKSHIVHLMVHNGKMAASALAEPRRTCIKTRCSCHNCRRSGACIASDLLKAALLSRKPTCSPTEPPLLSKVVELVGPSFQLTHLIAWQCFRAKGERGDFHELESFTLAVPDCSNRSLRIGRPKLAALILANASERRARGFS